MERHSSLSKNFPGELIKKDNYHYFLPGNIFESKTLTLNFSVQKKLEKTTLVLGKFYSKFKYLPSPKLFLRSYLKRESTTSSRIEGTQASIDDAFKDIEDIHPENRVDGKELQQYICAIDFAKKEIKQVGLTGRCIKETHKVLLEQSRGENKSPGEYRRTQNWITGGKIENASFIPPSHEIIQDAMSNLEFFIHDEETLIPDLVKIALIHYQFETIHPFLDGNGRIGRILIPLYLLEKKILEDPILYISDFFEKNRNDYYLRLNEARNNKEGVVKWIEFFLQAVHDTSLDGIDTTDEIIALHSKLKEKLGRSKSAVELVDFLFENPIISAKLIQEKLRKHPVTAQNLLADFEKQGVLIEITKQKRNRLFVFEEYLSILRR